MAALMSKALRVTTLLDAVSFRYGMNRGKSTTIIEKALNLVAITTERNGYMKKELKQTIFETVSTLRN